VALIGLLMLGAAASPAHAQECSGGPDGGMDATGSHCNSPAIASIDDASPSRAPADEDAVAIHNRGLAFYERGHYSAAVDLFRRAGERGDVRSAEMIVLMHRHNAKLYGGRVAITDIEAKRWAAVVARHAAASAATSAQKQR
jgi:hypothetical protein